jgi:hypothetical protein
MRKPTLTPASWLFYVGGFTVLGAALGALGYLASQYGDGAFVLWALLVLVVLYGLALAYKREDRWIAAGVFAVSSIVVWGVFVGALWNWFGWLDNLNVGSSPFSGFSVARLSLYLLILAAVWDDSRRFRFPLIALIGVFFSWLFVTDLISGGGSWSAVVTLFVGLVYLVIGTASDKPSAFWFHVAAGLLIGGALVYWWHAGDTRWALVCVVALVYIAIANATRRSSWAVLGSIGLLMATTHFATEWARGDNTGGLTIGPASVPSFQGWVPPLVFAFTGFLMVLLGLVALRRRPD